MTKHEFLAEIRNELGFLPQKDVDAAERYFESYFAGIESDEDVISRLGSPKDAARSYYSGNILSQKNNYEQVQPKKNRGNIWLIVIILVILSPILIPIAIAAGGMIMTIIASVIGLYIALLASGIGLWFGGAAAILKSLFAGMGMANTVFQCGIGCLMFGIGLMLTLLAAVIAVKLIPWLIRKIADFGSSRIRRRRSV